MATATSGPLSLRDRHIGSVPIIRCPKGEAAEIVGEKLDKKLRENLRDPRNSLFSSDSMATGALSFQRPLLVILDRSIDLASLLHHTWTYQALAHDILDFKLNRVEIEEFDETITTGDGRHPSKRRTYDLIPTDKFWKQQKGNPFPIVAESIQEELERYRQLEGEVTRLKTAMGIKGDAEDLAISLLNDTTSKLTSAVSSLPELLEKKRLLDLHTNIATALLDQIKKRKLDVFFETEEKLITKQVQEKSLMEVLSDPAAGTPEDKLRLFLIHYICTPTMTQSELDQYMTILRGSNCTHLEAIAYIKRWKSISKMSVVSQAREGGTTTMGMFSNLVNKASKFAMEGVKNLVVKQYKLPVTKILDNLMESRSSPETDDYRYFDPKLLRPADSANVARNRQSFSDAIVFMIGGGNYIEYQNLQDYAKTRSTMATKRVVYGCTELVNASQFLEHSKNFSEEEIDNFRQCFQLFAPQGYVDTPDKLCFIMRSLSMAPTLDLHSYHLVFLSHLYSISLTMSLKRTDTIAREQQIRESIHDKNVASSTSIGLLNFHLFSRSRRIKSKRCEIVIITIVHIMFALFVLGRFTINNGPLIQEAYYVLIDTSNDSFMETPSFFEKIH
ncbi:unnamed protein product [Rotaria socialis]|uniref:Sec1 family domain-containing protein 1 n=2 Tax=Rotaria socialis TaxID=392032 RepID=A0A820LKP1_9BILA|nr:unnamed protein product [Rotaria socialis]